MSFTCLLLSACPAEETALDRASARDRIERLAVIDDTPWRMAGAYVRTIEPVPSDSESPRWQQTPMADDLNFVLRFDREQGIAYANDGCQSFTMPLGYYRSEGLLSFDVSSLERQYCADTERLESQRQFIVELLSRVANVTVPLSHFSARDGQLQLKANLVSGANRILEPANLSGLDLGLDFGTALATGEPLQSTTLLSNDTAGLTLEDVHVFRNRAAFEYDWALRVNADADLQALDDVDYTTHTLVASTSGQHDTAGYRVEMNEVQVVDGEIHIDIRMISPHPSCQVEPITTRPAAFYAIPSRKQANPACQAPLLRFRICRSTFLTTRRYDSVGIQCPAPQAAIA